MDRYLYDCEVINNKLFLKFATFTGSGLSTEVHSIFDFMNGRVSVANAQITQNAVIMNGRTAHSSTELMDIIKTRDNITVGQAADGRIAVIDRLGRLVYQGAAVITPTPAIQQGASIQQPDPKAKIDELVTKLNAARDAYYNHNREIMSNFDYDRLYDILEELERKTGYVRPDSPTQNVGAELSKPEQQSAQQADYTQYKAGDKIVLPDAALSLDKTKDIDVLSNLLTHGDGVLSVKMDGLTVVLTYKNTDLQMAATRGNGHTGEICTENAKYIIGIPHTIPTNKEVRVRGEAYITYTDFDALNNTLSDEDKYKNPRNLASGSVRSFGKPNIVKQRKVRFCAYEIVNWRELGLTTFTQQLDVLAQLGFTDIVKHIHLEKSQTAAAVDALTATVKASTLPADGLVLRLNDLLLGESLGVATKFPKHSLAFKWEDAEVETELIDIDWTVGRTGRITPTAIFKPVDIEGSTVQRASIHNISMMEEILGQPYVGQKVKVYKANMIIPQLSEAEQYVPGETNAKLIEIPKMCPCCGEHTHIKVDPTSGVNTLWCNNNNCSSRGLQLWSHFVSRDAMNIKGLGESILQDMLALGIINNDFSSLYEATPYDMFRLCIEVDGYGETKVTNILDAVEKSKSVPLENVLYAYGIPNIGLQTAKTIVKLANYDLDELSSPNLLYKILETNGLGQVVATSWRQFMMSDKSDDFFGLCEMLDLQVPATATAELEGLTFCCTGDVYVYKNRKELQASIERRGGKFTTSVTGNTSYLITNDTTSGSAKNKAAQAKGIPIISEDQFIQMFGQ